MPGWKLEMIGNSGMPVLRRIPVASERVRATSGSNPTQSSVTNAVICFLPKHRIGGRGMKVRAISVTFDSYPQQSTGFNLAGLLLSSLTPARL